MKKSTFKWLFTLSTLLFAGVAVAQQRVLSLDEALEITMNSNPAIEAIAFQEKAALQERRAAIGLRMPKISITGAYTYLGKDIKIDLNDNKKKITDGISDFLNSGVIPPQLLPPIQEILPIFQGLLSPIMGMDWSYKLQDRSLGTIMGEVSIPLYLGGKINAANRAARIDESTIIEQGNQTRNALVSELVERYYGMALARQAVEVRKQVVEGVRKHLDDAIALERSGMIAHSEQLYLEFKMSEAERDFNNALLEAETISNALQNTLGQSMEEVIPASTMFTLSSLQDVGYFKALAEQNNPLIAQVNLKRQLAQEGVKVQRADFLPQVVAVGGGSLYNYQVNKSLPRWAVGVGVNIKLFDGLNREFKYSAARQTVRQVEALERKAVSDIDLLIEKIYGQLENCTRQIASIETSMAFAEEYLRVKNAAFLEGMSSSSDLIDAELNLAKVRIERMQTAYRYDVLLARLLEAAGVSDEYARYLHREDAKPIQF
jgi:outer membrane protein TolC